MYNDEIECALSCVFFFNTDVTIDWQLSAYRIMEGDGLLLACAEIMSGSLERDVVVECETADAQVAQQATGKNNTVYSIA